METAALIHPPVVAASLAPGAIYRGDCIALMREEMAGESINMIYADPPYNASHRPLALPNNKTGGAYYKINESWDLFTESGYARFCEGWITQAHRVLKPSGSLFVACSMHNIGEVIVCAKRLGLQQKNIIVWRKPNAMPNITKRVFTHTTEYTCWFVKGSGWTFNYDALKALNPARAKDGTQKQMPDFVEMPLVQGKERICDDNTRRALHPAQKPEKLLEIFITAATNSGDIVLDPFMGSGTTAVVAERLRRQWIGMELDDRYIDAANKRICQAQQK